MTAPPPKSQAYELDAFFVPGHWFFCRRIALPADLEAGEERDFVLLELEALSPFPLDHLHYGIRFDETKRHAFVFAAYKRRFERIDASGWRSLDAVVPDFLVGLHPEAKGDKGLVIVTETSLVALNFDGASDLPSSFWAEARPEHLADAEEDRATQDAAVQEFARAARLRFDFGTPRIWFANREAKWIAKEAWFGAVDADETPEARVSFERDQLWDADLRDPEMVQLAKTDVRQNGLLWKVIGGLAACIALMLFGELYWGGSTGYLAYKKAQVSEREQPVADVVELSGTNTTLRDFLESNQPPFAMIESLFPYQQYPDIIYRKFETEGVGTVRIDAEARNQSQVTAFKQRLENFDKVSNVELSNQRNDGKGTSFTATINFKGGAFFEIVEVGSNG